MKDFIIKILGTLVVLLGGTLLFKNKFKNPFNKKEPFIMPPGVKPLRKPPDISKIKEKFKNETPEESVDHVNDLFDELFPDS